MMDGFTPPKPRPTNHLAVLPVEAGFFQAVLEGMERHQRDNPESESRTVSEQILHWAQVGAECERLHLRQDHQRRRTRK